MTRKSKTKEVSAQTRRVRHFDRAFRLILDCAILAVGRKTALRVFREVVVDGIAVVDTPNWADGWLDGIIAGHGNCNIDRHVDCNTGNYADGYLVGVLAGHSECKGYPNCGALKMDGECGPGCDAECQADHPNLHAEREVDSFSSRHPNRDGTISANGDGRWADGIA